jgi:hypothetical protein
MTPERAPAEQMVSLLAGFQVAQALYAAAALGIPDALASGPRTMDEVADVLQLDRDASARLARTLGSIGLFSVSDDGAYELTPLGATLTSDAPDSMRDLALMWMETHYAPFARLSETIRTGRSAADLYYERPFFDWLGEHPDQVARFTGAMGNLTDGIKSAALASCDFTSSRRILDVGGADGTLLAHVLHAVPDAVGTVLDLPHVVPAVEAHAKEQGLSDRLDAIGGDFFQAVPGGYDTYVMSMILHDWDDERATRLLSNIARSAASGARVVALELVVPPGNVPHMAKMIDLTMLAMLTGRERTEPEFRALIEGAWLRFEGATSSAGPISVVEARVR